MSRTTQLPLMAAAALLLTAGLACSEKQPASHKSASATESTADDADLDAASTDHAGQVLRHAVFFRFKEKSSADEVRRVVEAFRALPDKIPEIQSLQWGTNNSPEGLNDGFTHGFLLTFADEAGRAAYLPHPAHAGEFADILRPHMQQAFVIDYRGTPCKPLASELKHCVFLRFRQDATRDQIRHVEEEFAALPSKIPSIKAFEWGVNNSPEKHDDGFTHCFMVTFESEDGRAAYLPHPAHAAFVEVLKPVMEAVRVIDFTSDR